MNRLVVVVVAAWLCGCVGDNVHEHEVVPTGAVCDPMLAVGYEDFGRPFLERNCTRCHRSDLHGSSRHGAPAEHNFESIDLVRDQLDMIDGTAAAGPLATNEDMPINAAPPPTIDERMKLGVWLACGAP